MPDIIVTPVVEPVVTPTTPIVQPVTPPNPTPAKTFSQEDVDNIVTTRLAKERAKYFKKFGVEDDSKLDEVVAKVTEHATLKAENESLKAEKLNRQYESKLNGLNVDQEFLDIVLSKVEKGKDINEFEANAKVYLAAHPKMLKESFNDYKSGPRFDGSPAGLPDFTKMSDADYVEWTKTHNLDGSLKRTR